MSAVEPSTKTCARCKQAKNLADFYVTKQSWCMDCSRTDARERMRVKLGTPEGRAAQRRAVNASRARTGNAAGKRRERVRRKAIAALIDRHHREFEVLVSIAERETPYD